MFGLWYDVSRTQNFVAKLGHVNMSHDITQTHCHLCNPNLQLSPKQKQNKNKQKTK